MLGKTLILATFMATTKGDDVALPDPFAISGFFEETINVKQKTVTSINTDQQNAPNVSMLLKIQVTKLQLQLKQFGSNQQLWQPQHKLEMSQVDQLKLKQNLKIRKYQSQRLQQVK
ncbi:hypothetical protein WICMUC_003038 [Wickerhamomyces mucosus]|uniref:Uncharacterized protein n=1 Tax=Wickerhamomyces mucosus TaxID=1378264 RepID=A0A9P8PNQ4_9ASCO|nr:hypothetical protein WICMUC_003038 [Wickerhamomyces mucosus]